MQRLADISLFESLQNSRSTSVTRCFNDDEEAPDIRTRLFGRFRRALKEAKQLFDSDFDVLRDGVSELTKVNAIISKFDKVEPINDPKFYEAYREKDKLMEQFGKALLGLRQKVESFNADVTDMFSKYSNNALDCAGIDQMDVESLLQLRQWIIARFKSASDIYEQAKRVG